MTSSNKRKQAPGPATQKSTKRAALNKRKSAWAADVVLSSPRSPLIKANLREIILLDKAWDCLPEDKQKRILSLFPSGNKYITTAPDGTRRPNITALSSSNSFRYDIARYQENIQLGRHDPFWLEDAWQAHRRRLEGYYDEALEDKFKQTWGIEARAPPPLAPRFAKMDARATVDAARADSSLFSDPRVDLRETAAELMQGWP
ncbi:hypothetical protein TD95_000205 [Thielaviopsis punctulata]|uniref:ASX DEUBAD domain-containing protein n=1 Tax=Thielaviopsis punctulata TaxID=72032 RepID=A0A0F4ZE29_9PEZI|nr:hypothetical protein TD95_000205 [Thielaviopsis punctulata]